MPKITQDGATHGPAEARVTETDDPAIQREIHARELRTHAAENVGLRRERDDLRRQLDEATLSAAERDKQNDDAEMPKPSKVAGDTESDNKAAESGRKSGTVTGDADDKSTGTTSTGKSGTFKLDSDK